MKFSVEWLRALTNVELNNFELAALLTKGGLEVEDFDATSMQVAIPPNRADCASMFGIARELMALQFKQFIPPKLASVAATNLPTLKVAVVAKQHCPVFCYRVVTCVNAAAATPEFILNRLKNAGINPISIIVDINNYVMLELGQPLHAFDVDKLEGDLQVRMSASYEKVTLLDESEHMLEPPALVVADAQKVQAVAGVMGAINSGVQHTTTNILLECAYYTPGTIRQAAKLLKKPTESSFRFERDIDPCMQNQALERASALIAAYAGGEFSQIIVNSSWVESEHPIALRPVRINMLLGTTITTKVMREILLNLNMTVNSDNDLTWQVFPPSYRRDLILEQDLVEEVGRVYGLDNIVAHAAKSLIEFGPTSANNLSQQALEHHLVAQGFSETISYSFISEILHQEFSTTSALELINPISADLKNMRASLLPSLVATANYNLQRQIKRAKFFEIGLTYNLLANQTIEQRKMLGLLIYGSKEPISWENSATEADFYTIKTIISNVLALAKHTPNISFEPALDIKGLHPNKSSYVLINGMRVGYFGAIHPKTQQTLNLKQTVLLAELQLEHILKLAPLKFDDYSKFPSIKRDLALLLDDNIQTGDLINACQAECGNILSDIKVIDVYKGQAIEHNKKSVAISLTFQDLTKTLVVDEIAQVMDNLLTILANNFGAQVR